MRRAIGGQLKGVECFNEGIGLKNRFFFEEGGTRRGVANTAEIQRGKMGYASS
jgi:hypothetical protein